MDNTALFNIGYGLYLLSAKENQRDNACITNTFMQITGDPLQMLLGVNKQNFTHDMILSTGEFNISMLTEKAPFEVFSRFGMQSGRNVDKFSGFDPVARSTNGLLYLTDYANSYLSCRVNQSTDMGTHTLFRAVVTDSVVLSKEPSVTYSYYQSKIKPAPAATPKKGYRCRICGYIYDGEPLPADFICPLCKHPASDFEKL